MLKKLPIASKCSICLQKLGKALNLLHQKCNPDVKRLRYQGPWKEIIMRLNDMHDLLN